MEVGLWIACLLAGFALVQSQCPPSWTKVENSCYRAFRKPETYDRASQICKQFVGCDGISPGHLASPSSFEERRAVRKVRSDLLGPLRGAQMGEGQRLRPVTVFLGLRLGQGANSRWDSTEQYDGHALNQFWRGNEGMAHAPGQGHGQRPGQGPGQRPGQGPGQGWTGQGQRPGQGPGQGWAGQGQGQGWTGQGQRPGQGQGQGWTGQGQGWTGQGAAMRFDPTAARWQGRCMTLPGQVQMNGAVPSWGHVACNMRAAYICEISAPGIVDRNINTGGFNASTGMGPGMPGGGRGGWGQGGQGGQGGWGQGGQGGWGQGNQGQWGQGNQGQWGQGGQGGFGAGGRGQGTGWGQGNQGGAGRWNPNQGAGGAGGWNPNQGAGGAGRWGQNQGGAGGWNPNQGAGGAGGWNPNQGNPRQGAGRWNPQNPQNPRRPMMYRQGMAVAMP